MISFFHLIFTYAFISLSLCADIIEVEFEAVLTCKAQRRVILFQHQNIPEDYSFISANNNEFHCKKNGECTPVDQMERTVEIQSVTLPSGYIGKFTGHWAASDYIFQYFKGVSQTSDVLDPETETLYINYLYLTGNEFYSYCAYQPDYAQVLITRRIEGSPGLAKLMPMDQTPFGDKYILYGVESKIYCINLCQWIDIGKRVRFVRKVKTLGFVISVHKNSPPLLYLTFDKTTLEDFSIDVSNGGSIFTFSCDDFPPNTRKICTTNDKVTGNSFSFSDKYYAKLHITEEKKLELCNKKVDSVSWLCVPLCRSNGADNTFDNYNECVPSCPSNLGIVYDYCIRSIEVKAENDTVISLEGDEKELKDIIINNVEDFSNYRKTMLFDNFTVQFHYCDNPIEDVGYTKIQSQKLDNYINSKERTLAEESLAVYKVETFTPEEITNKVEFIVLTKEGDIVLGEQYKNIKLELFYPIHENVLSLVIPEAYYNKGFDIFDVDDPLFNDLCTPFETENDTDMLVRDRRKDIFPNVTFCTANPGCVYAGVNYTTRQVKCECTIGEENPKIYYNEFHKNIFNHNLGVLKCGKKFSKLKGNNVGFFLGIILIVAMITSSLLFFIKDYPSLKDNLHQYWVKSNPPTAENATPQVMTNYPTTNTESELVKKDNENMNEKVIGFPKEIDNFTFQNAYGKDQRSFFEIFWAIYLHQEDITKICRPARKYELFTVNIIFYIMNLCLLLMMNAIFFTNHQFTSRYHKGSLNFGEDLLRAIPSNIITAVICAIVKALMAYSSKIEAYIEEIKTTEINEKITDYYRFVRIKHIIFISVLFVVLIFNFYYLTLFCIIYKASQIKWFVGCVYSVIIEAIINAILSLLLAGMRKFSFRYNNKNIYNLEIFLKDKV